MQGAAGTEVAHGLVPPARFRADPRPPRTLTRGPWAREGGTS